MASIIDTSFFYHELEVAQADSQAVQSNLQWYIDKYEQEYLRLMLGYDLWNLYNTNAAQQIYLDIKDGKEFTDSYGALNKWNGLKFQVQAAPVRYGSPIANYVYCKYTKDQQTATTGTGEKTLNAQNATDSTAWMKIARAWNEMVDQNRVLYQFLNANNLVYPSWSVYKRRRHNYLFQNMLSKINPVV